LISVCTRKASGSTKTPARGRNLKTSWEEDVTDPFCRSHLDRFSAAAACGWPVFELPLFWGRFQRTAPCLHRGVVLPRRSPSHFVKNPVNPPTYLRCPVFLRIIFSPLDLCQKIFELKQAYLS
jgi:hypothetical protein